MRWVVVVATILAGCSTGSEMESGTGSEVEQRGGKTYRFEFHGHAIRCAGTPSSLDKCYEKAAGVCGAKGYVVHQIVEQKGDARLKAGDERIPTMVILISCK